MLPQRCRMSVWPDFNPAGHLQRIPIKETGYDRIQALILCRKGLIRRLRNRRQNVKGPDAHFFLGGGGGGAVDMLVRGRPFLTAHPCPCAQPIDFEERLLLNRKVETAMVIVWSFSDPLHPQFVLEAPNEVNTIKFNPNQPHILAGVPRCLFVRKLLLLPLCRRLQAPMTFWPTSAQDEPRFPVPLTTATRRVASHVPLVMHNTGAGAGADADGPDCARHSVLRPASACSCAARRPVPSTDQDCGFERATQRHTRRWYMGCGPLGGVDTKSYMKVWLSVQNHVPVIEKQELSMGCKAHGRVPQSQSPNDHTTGMAWGKLACARGGGGGIIRAPQRRGGGSGKGALVTGQSQEAGLTPLMMTHQLRRDGGPEDVFFKKNFSHDTHLKVISASWGIILSHICCGTSGPPQTSPVSPLGVPVTGAEKGGGGSGRGARTTPPPRASQFPPSPWH